MKLKDVFLIKDQFKKAIDHLKSNEKNENFCNRKVKGRVENRFFFVAFRGFSALKNRKFTSQSGSDNGFFDFTPEPP